MERNPDFAQHYKQFMTEFLNLGHMSLITDDQEGGYYTPHHGVFSANKFRTVFNSSYPTSSGISLNDCQLTGPKLQADLPTILNRFRRFKCALTADIVKMYRQIEIHPEDRQYQKIIWRNSPNEELRVYEINRIAYGQAAAPFLALRTLQQCAQEHQNEHPLGTKHILSSFYMDDLLTGADSEMELHKVQQDISQVLTKGCLPLAKWCSNTWEVNEKLEVKFDETEEARVLGLRWLPHKDILTYRIKEMPCHQQWTKRQVVSQIGQLFDPNGFVAPAIISAKILIQDLWKSKLDWDENIPSDFNQNWTTYLTELSNMNIEIPRWLGTKTEWKTELHFFSDASEKAYATCVYARTITNTGNVHTALIQSKTRVAPLKTTTIPRLELCGALLSSTLLDPVLKSFEEINNVYFWTDSTTVLRWLGKSPDQLKTFVANRVAEIQEKTTQPGYKWRWTPGVDNPADLASRGIPPSALEKNDLWWTGPSWLKQDENQWPMAPIHMLTDDDDDSEIKPLIHHIAVDPPLDRGPWYQHHRPGKSMTPTSLLSTYSKFSTLHNAATGILRAVSNFKARKNTEKKTVGPSSPEERDQSLQYLVKTDQAQTYSKELQQLTDTNPSKPKDRTLLLDPRGILRYNGRVVSPNLTYNEQYPMLLSPHGYLAKLLIKQAHEKTMHGGTQLILQLLRQNFWIPKARRLTRSVIAKCLNCARQNAPATSQIMAPLPANRTTPSRPFSHCGLDYLGPVKTSSKTGRNPTITKGYVCVFVCFITRAIHLELASDASTPQFIAALRRMIARRGPIHRIHSDNAKNFVGAANFLEAIKQTYNWAADKLKIQWDFQTPLSPHHGGLHEAAVKSVKHHLKRTIGDAHLTFEEFSTLLTQVEACVNSRPIMPLSDDPQNLTALTPGHFLVGENLITLIEPRPLENAKVSHLTRWEQVQQKYQQFWLKWHHEYLLTLSARQKWTKETTNLKMNDMVLLREDNVPPTQWRLGRITEVYPGKDGLIRTVDVRVTEKNKTKTYLRPITKITLLYSPDPDNIQDHDNTNP